MGAGTGGLAWPGSGCAVETAERCGRTVSATTCCPVCVWEPGAERNFAGGAVGTVAMDKSRDLPWSRATGNPATPDAAPKARAECVVPE